MSAGFARDNIYGSVVTVLEASLIFSQKLLDEIVVDKYVLWLMGIKWSENG